MSKIDLIHKVGISKNTLNRYEKGITHPKLSILNKIASALDVDPHYLYDEFYLQIGKKSCSTTN